MHQPLHAHRRSVALLGLLTAGLLATQAQAQTQVYQHWPLKASATDSAAVRSTGINASTPTLKRLVVSDGSATANARPYSALYGQAIAPAALGANWGTSAGGPGGSLKRTFYEQFTVTAASGATVRADSLIITAGFLTTASSTNMGVVYSRSNFTSDSTDVSGGKGPNGVFTGSITGGFTGPVALQQVATGSPNTNTYRMALNGATGVTLNAGQTLTIRVYVSCSSTGANSRFALFKDVIVKSRQTVTATRNRNTALLAAYPNPVQDQLRVQHTAATQPGSLTVYSATGRRVAEFSTQPGSSATTLPLGGLPTGIYLVQYQNGTERLTSRIVKQ